MATTLSVGRVVYKKGLAKEDKIGASQMYGAYGVFGGGRPTIPAYTTTIDYITISTPGNALVFGSLTESRGYMGATSDGSTGVFGGGAPSYYNTIEYITISTPSDTTDFGDLTQSRNALSATSDGSRGVFGGGRNDTLSPIRLDTIDYIPITTPGDATDFGDLTQGRSDVAATSDGSRGVFGGGYSDTPTAGVKSTIDYITISTPGNVTDFGGLTTIRGFLPATSDGSRGVFGGGYSTGNVSTIDYITISTPSDATVFGNLTGSRESPGATSDGSRGVFGGGYAFVPTVGTVTTIDYITISTPNVNATVFGGLTVGRYGVSATSGD